MDRVGLHRKGSLGGLQTLEIAARNAALSIFVSIWKLPTSPDMPALDSEHKTPQGPRGQPKIWQQGFLFRQWKKWTCPLCSSVNFNMCTGLHHHHRQDAEQFHHPVPPRFPPTAPLKSQPPPLPQPLAATDSFIVSRVLSFPECPRVWNHTVCRLFRLSCFT